MSKTLSYEISDEIREAIAEKLGLSSTPVEPMEIPCTYYYSSNEVKLYLDLAGTQPSQSDHISGLSFLGWYDTNYPAANYEDDADRLGHFIMDLIQRGAYFYTIEGDRQTGTSGMQVSLSDKYDLPVSLSDKVKINGIRTFNNYLLLKEQKDSGGDYGYILRDMTNKKDISDIVSNSDIADGTEFISFYLDMSQYPAADVAEINCYVTICK